MTIVGDANDKVKLNGDFSHVGTETIDAVDYNVYEDGDGNESLYIETEVTVIA